MTIPKKHIGGSYGYEDILRDWLLFEIKIQFALRDCGTHIHIYREDYPEQELYLDLNGLPTIIAHHGSYHRGLFRISKLENLHMAAPNFFAGLEVAIQSCLYGPEEKCRLKS